MTRAAAPEATRTRGDTRLALHLRIHVRFQQCGDYVAVTALGGVHQSSHPILRAR